MAVFKQAHGQQVLVYEKHGDTIKALARAIDLLGHDDINEALRVLQAHRDHLMHQQKPKLMDYDPRRAQQEAEEAQLAHS